MVQLHFLEKKSRWMATLPTFMLLLPLLDSALPEHPESVGLGVQPYFFLACRPAPALNLKKMMSPSSTT
uniref:Putative secreted protein n=1 Tax=Ixodes ricinus TaxID=34613 RepID=A0A6B0TWX3_IXORI